MGSADWMPRNLFERCEVVFPVKDKAARARIHEEILPAYLADTAKARLMQEDGEYIRANDGKKPHSELQRAGIPDEARRRQSRAGSDSKGSESGRGEVRADFDNCVHA